MTFSFAVEYDNSLETDLKGDTSGDLETLLVELSKVLATISVKTNAKKGGGGLLPKISNTIDPSFLLASFLKGRN